MSSPTPHQFDDPIWSIRDVLGWVLDREAMKFGRLFSDEDIKSALLRTAVYKRRGRPERDPQVLTTVLHALQRGKLTAYNGRDPVPRDFWIDKTRQYVRDSTGFRFKREEILALWPDPRVQVSRAPLPITPFHMAAAVSNNLSSENRAVNWQKWKHVPEVKLYEAVALSLDIAPEKLRPNRHVWMGGGKRFDESEEFLNRLFVAERNLQNLKPLNLVSAAIEGGDLFVSLQAFATWALSIGWSLPRELAELATPASAGTRWPTPQPDGKSARPSRYVSKRDRARQVFCTLPQWVEIVQTASNCDGSAAQDQILDGLCDEAFAIEWEEDDGGRINSQFMGRPPPWREANIDWKTGKVNCDGGLPVKGGVARWLTPLLAPRGPSAFEQMLAERRNARASSAAPILNVVEEPGEGRRGGRKKGSGSIDDTISLREMLHLLATAQARSVLEAARKVAQQMVRSSQSPDADIARLRRKFANDHHGTNPPFGKTWADVAGKLNAN